AYVEVEGDAAWPPGAAADAPVPERVVLLALLGLGQHVVRRLHLLELRLGRLVARIAVRVVLPRELAVGLLDLVGRRVLRNAEDVVEIFRLGRHQLTRPRSPARGGSPCRRCGSPSGARRVSPRTPSRRPVARAAP